MISYLILVATIYFDVAIRHTHFLSFISLTGIAVALVLSLRLSKHDILFRQILFISVIYGIFLQQNLGIVLIASAIAMFTPHLVPKAVSEFKLQISVLVFFSIFFLLSGTAQNLDRFLFMLFVNTGIVILTMYFLNRFTHIGKSSQILR